LLLSRLLRFLTLPSVGSDFCDVGRGTESHSLCRSPATGHALSHPLPSRCGCRRAVEPHPIPWDKVTSTIPLTLITIHTREMSAASKDIRPTTHHIRQKSQAGVIPHDRPAIGCRNRLPLRMRARFKPTMPSRSVTGICLSTTHHIPLTLASRL
jgi:hypothetical protein